MRALVISMILVGCRGSEHKPAPTPDPALVATPVAARHHTPPATPASATAFYANTFERQPTVHELTEVGGLAFADPSLSASGKVACATCHAPDRAFGPTNAAAVQLGGVRAAPSIRYLAAVPRFTEHMMDSESGVDQGPAGGLTWDGRAQSTHDQAHLPLFSALEMANESPDALTERLRHAAYADRLRAVFGPGVLDHADSAVKALTLALEVYQQDPIFYPYSSKYDDVLRGTGTLSVSETRGKALFDDPKKGNCASCHPDTVSSGFPAFTDYGFVALGVPRNREIKANADPAYFDLGLCGPYRTDFAGRADYCGKFRTPSLRNVALRRRFMHNGVFTSLTQVVRFYATRDTQPAAWGSLDDLPAKYRGNLERGAPFGSHLSETDIADIVAFLGTLTDREPPSQSH
jgi:cytochrome c peroxidase